MNNLLEPNSGYKPLIRQCDDPVSNFQKIRRTRVVDGKTVVTKDKPKPIMRKVRLTDIMTLE